MASSSLVSQSLTTFPSSLFKLLQLGIMPLAHSSHHATSTLLLAYSCLLNTSSLSSHNALYLRPEYVLSVVTHSVLFQL